MERELWQALYLLAVGLDKRWGRWKYSTAEIVVVYFWAVLHDRPTSWATYSRPSGRRIFGPNDFRRKAR